MANQKNAERFGLPETAIRQMQQVFAEHPSIQQVVLYGSRAKGNYRVASDIDLTLKGQGITLNTLLAVEIELDDLLLPWQIDLSIYEQIDNQALCEHINRRGIEFYSAQQTPKESAK